MTMRPDNAMNTEGQLTTARAARLRRGHCGNWWPKPRTVPARNCGRVALNHEVFALPGKPALWASAVSGRNAQHVKHRGRDCTAMQHYG